MKVLIINNSIQECGVHQYGKRVGQIASKSLNHHIVYLEINTAEEFFVYVDKEQPSVIIYNYLGSILPWCSTEVISNIRSRGIKQGTIIHNSPQNFFDFYLHQDPNFVEHGNNYKLLRPIFEYYSNEVPSFKSFKVGSFGFGLNCKNYPLLCKTLKDHLQDSVFDTELNLHLTVGAFANNDLNFIKDIEKRCLAQLQGSRIKLNVTTDFISQDKLLEFLSCNHINVFYYEKYNFYNGISSSVDHALSVDRPIAICRSNMFSHIWNASPSICLEDSNIQTIFNNWIYPLIPYKEMWSNENFRKNFERIINLVG